MAHFVETVLKVSTELSFAVKEICRCWHSMLIRVSVELLNFKLMSKEVFENTYT